MTNYHMSGAEYLASIYGTEKDKVGDLIFYGDLWNWCEDMRNVNFDVPV